MGTATWGRRSASPFRAIAAAFAAACCVVVLDHVEGQPLPGVTGACSERDVLVQPEEVGGVVLALQCPQARVLLVSV